MGNLTFKPADEGHLILQNDASTTAIEIKDDEANVYMENGDIITGTTGKVKQKGAFMQSSTHQSLLLGY
jgi:NOL1/NOP2/fmu family ribosome biogenesis protein